MPTSFTLDSCFVLYVFVLSSDSLVEQAAGGESAAKLKETDEKGFRDSEVHSRIYNLIME